jgi:hypothetical protein
MTCRHVCVLLALASPIAMSGCTPKSETKPGADSGPGANRDTADAIAAAAPDTADAAPDSAPDVFVPTCLSVEEDLIADFKENNGLNPADGREGGFYLYGDGSIKGTFDPPLVAGESYPIDPDNGNDECSGPGSFHTKATGWGVWGSALGTDFKPKGEDGFKGSYDASRYRGISFWAKAAEPIKRVQVSFKDIYTDGDASFAGTNAADAGISQCVYVPDPTVNCSPYLVKFGDPSFPAYQDYQIDTTWKRFDIYFEDTLQDVFNLGFHTAEDKVDTQHLTGFAIQANADFSTNPPTPNDYEIWIDDVYFIQ